MLSRRLFTRAVPAIITAGVLMPVKSLYKLYPTITQGAYWQEIDISIYYSEWTKPVRLTRGVLSNHKLIYDTIKTDFIKQQLSMKDVKNAVAQGIISGHAHVDIDPTFTYANIGPVY